MKKQEWTEVESAQHCGVTQPRISYLLRGKFGAGGGEDLLGFFAGVSRIGWLPVMSGLIAFGAVLFMPSEIQVTQQGVEERGLLGFRKKRVAWEGAAA